MTDPIADSPPSSIAPPPASAPAPAPASAPAPAPALSPAPAERDASSPRAAVGRDRGWLAIVWYRFVQQAVSQLWIVIGGLRASGQKNIPKSGGVLLVSNHLSHFDVFILGLLIPRTLNYVARSTLFIFPLNHLIRSVGGFPIQRDGLGAQGVKETLRRLKRGGIVTFFPEGTRSRDGEIGELKPGLAALAAKAKVPIVPAGIAGTFESWPRGQSLPKPHPIRVHYGEPIQPEDLRSRTHEQIMELIRERMLDAQRQARAGLRRDLGV